MDYHSNRTMFIRRPISNKKIPPVRWVRDWVPQENAATGKTIYLLKWVRADMLKAIKDKFKEPEPVEAKPEPTTEILYLCTFEGCNKVFPTEGTYRKHAHIHGERQHACTYPGCGKKFLDSSKLKRHQVVHTGEKNYICTYEGCGKAFNLDFNLRAHMKIHSQEHYHICQYPDCGKRYTQECKLRSHIKSAHEKNTPDHIAKNTPHTPHTPQTPQTPHTTYTPVMEKIAKPPTPISAPHSSDRPFVCPYEGCGKDYIHEYKLNLHLKSQHPGHFPEENEQVDQNTYIAKGGIGKNTNRIKPNITNKMPPAKLTQPKGMPGANVGAVSKQESMRQEIYRVGMHGDDSDDSDSDDSDDDSDGSDDDDSEETEEERDNIVRDDWRFRNNEGGDDEETEDEN